MRQNHQPKGTDCAGQPLFGEAQGQRLKREGGLSIGGCRPWLAEIGDFRIKRLFMENLERPRAQILAKTCYSCIKRLFTESLERPRAQIWPKLAPFVLSGPLKKPSKGPGPRSEIGDFRIKRLFTESLERPRAQIWPKPAISVISGPLQRASKGTKGPGPRFGRNRLSLY